jgi:Spy/CpxP family protein refolding chaperone
MWQQPTPEQQQQMRENMQRGGYGPGMTGCYGPGYGMGPGMMSGYGPGYDMMVPGMMGGYGPGYGMGPGMMGGWAGLDLTDAQKAQMEKIHDSLQEKHRKLMSEMWDEQAKLAKLYNAERRDPAAIGKAHDRLSKLQREALQARIEAENKFDDMLTKEQKAKVRRGRGWSMMGY